MPRHLSLVPPSEPIQLEPGCAAGLFKAECRSAHCKSTGVVFIDQTQILQGGDSDVFFAGAFSVDGRNVIARVVVGRHTDGRPSVFGDQTRTYDLKGKIRNSKEINLDAWVGDPEQPEHTLSITLWRLSDHPGELAITPSGDSDRAH